VSPLLRSEQPLDETIVVTSDRLLVATLACPADARDGIVTGRVYQRDKSRKQVDQLVVCLAQAADRRAAHALDAHQRLLFGAD